MAEGVARLIGPSLGVLLITHYQRILNYIKPDHIHVMMDGRIVLSGGPELAHELEREGLRGPAQELGLDEAAASPGEERGHGAREGRPTLDVERIRKDFPILERGGSNGDRPLVYLDSATTSQKPRRVIDAITEYYERHNANLHRGVYTLAEEATEMYEAARAKLAALRRRARRRVHRLQPRDDRVGEPGRATAGRARFLREGDEILLSEVEHHSNLVPWQFAAGRRARCCGSSRSPTTARSTCPSSIGC